MEMPGLMARSKKYGVGKEIGGAVYLHRQYESLLGEAVANAKTHLPDDFDYTVVKYSEKTGLVSFIASPNFDTAPEPTVGDSIAVTPDGRVSRRKQLADPYIYHHKWLFVADDYEGFGVSESKRRSLAWMALPDIDRRRIGRQRYWSDHVLNRLKRTQSSSRVDRCEATE